MSRIKIKIDYKVLKYAGTIWEIFEESFKNNELLKVTDRKLIYELDKLFEEGIKEGIQRQGLKQIKKIINKEPAKGVLKRLVKK